MLVLLKAGLIKKYIIKMSEYFLEPNSSGRRQKVELDLSNYTTKANFKKCNGCCNIGFLPKKSDLVTSKSNADKLDFAKLKNIATFFSSLKSKVDELDVNKLVPENDVIKKDYLVTNATLNAKINEIKDDIPGILNLATSTDLNAIKKEVKKYLILLSYLLLLLVLLLKMKYLMLVIHSKKTYYNTKIGDIENKITTDHDHDKYITSE